MKGQIILSRLTKRGNDGRRSFTLNWMAVLGIFIAGIALGANMSASRKAFSVVNDQHSMVVTSLAEFADQHRNNGTPKLKAKQTPNQLSENSKFSPRAVKSETLALSQEGSNPMKLSPSKSISSQASIGKSSAAKMKSSSAKSSPRKSISSKVSPKSTSVISSSSKSKDISIYDMLRQSPDSFRNFPRTNKTISACLFAMDDSIRLAEWIAYHYTVLPLGSLTIAIDPQSRSHQRVLDVLDLWRDRIDIQAYTNDSDWMPYEWDYGWGRRIYTPMGQLMPWFLDKDSDIYRSQAHKRRQNGFALQCMRKYKTQWDKQEPPCPGPKWLLMTDSDEFLLYNYIHAEEEDDQSYEVKRGTTPEMIDELRRKRIPMRQRLPSMRQQVSIADWLEVENGKSRCWKFPGLFMSSYDSTAEHRNADVPEGIDANQLMTLRFRKAGIRYGNFSKSLLDVSWGELERYGKDEVQNIHNPHKRICGVNGQSGSNADYISSAFRINHYSAGSLEAFAERSNDRRVSADTDAFERFRSRNVAPVTEDDDIRPWIEWFVGKVGMGEAERLLVKPLRERYEEFSKNPFVMANKDKVTGDLEAELDEFVEDSSEVGGNITEGTIFDMLRKPPEKIRAYPKTNKTISACLFAMDDSIKLVEWIAYHYTVLPLGSLTVAIDPNSNSQERVLNVLNRWKDRIDIKAYTNDSEWMPWKYDEGWGRKIYRQNGELANWLVTKSGPVYRSQSHKRRQNAFALHCMRRYKTMIGPHFDDKRNINPEWVLMTDSDEFLLYNYIHPDQEDENMYAVKRGTGSDAIDALRRKNIPRRRGLPSMSDRVTIADWLKVENRNLRCWQFPGLFMSSYDSPAGIIDHDVPEVVDAKNLMTLRFRQAGVRFGNFSKALLDVSWGRMDQYGKDDVQNIHNPHKRICGVNGHTGSNADYLASVFRINHYSAGSLESFVERSNDRRYNHKNITFSRFQSRNVDPVNEDDDIRPWINWFVEKVGVDEAKRLLVDPLKDLYDEFSQHYFVVEVSKKLEMLQSTSQN